MNNYTEQFNFMAIGQAIKMARVSGKITREQLAEQLDIAPRHLQAIENEGQHPSFQLFIRLVMMFNISVDQYIFINKNFNKTTLRRQVDTLLNVMDDKELVVIEATAKGLYKAREQMEE